MGEVRVSGFSLPRKWPTLATMKPSRRWGTRLWWYGQMWATRPTNRQLYVVGGWGVRWVGGLTCVFWAENGEIYFGMVLVVGRKTVRA
jgi:hypothetical protein